MAYLALLLLFPMIWPFIAKAIWKHEITLIELSTNIVVVVLAVLAAWYGGTYAQSADVEILNGRVTGKDSEHVSCEHSYSCNCREVCSGSGQNRSCSTQCDTCYEHPYDIDWTLRTSVEDIEVPRVDRRGTEEPPRWTSAKAGDPVAVTHTHTNYIKGAPDSLFSAVAEQSALARFGKDVPAYPSAVYDLHYVNRVLAAGVSIPDIEAWNSDLASRLRLLGPAKQANWVVLITSNPSQAYADAVRVKWLGGKKNDVVVVLGAPEYPKLSWVRVLSWTDKELFKVELRDDLLALNVVDRERVLGTLERHTTSSFVRKQMRDFEYLSSEILPPTWLIVLIAIGGALCSVGLSIHLSTNHIRDWAADQPIFRRKRFNRL